MNVRLFCPIAALAFALTAAAQDATTSPQSPPPSNQGQRGAGGRGGWGRGEMGRGLMGTVTDVAADHYTIKTENGETYTVHFSANTRILKQQARARGEGGQAAADGGQRGGGQGGYGQGGNPPITLKPTDIKVGDAIAAMGEIDATSKSVGAVMIMQIDPERAKQMREMQANYGKTWLAGKVTAIDGVKVTLMGGVDNSTHTFTADENTTFRKRRDPITLADIQVGDMIRVDGSMKDGAFLATTVNAMGAPPAGETNVPPLGQPPAPPQ